MALSEPDYKGEIAGLNRKITELDRRVAAVTSERDAARQKAAELVKAGSETNATLTARLDRIERKHAEKIRALDLRYHGRERAKEMGIPVELVDSLKADDESDLDAKLAGLASALEARESEALNKAMVERSHKPGAGGETPKRRELSLEQLNRMSPASFVK